METIKEEIGLYVQTQDGTIKMKFSDEEDWFVPSCRELKFLILILKRTINDNDEVLKTNDTVDEYLTGRT